MDLRAKGLMRPGGAARSGRAIVLAIVVIVLIGAGAAATYWLTRPRSIEVAQAAPANASAFVALDLTPALERGTKLHQLWKLAKDKEFDETLRAGVESVVEQLGPEFDVQKDLFDWFGGELAFVRYPVASDKRDDAVLITARDVGKARKTLAKVRSAMAEDRQTFRRSRHRRVNITAGELQSEPVACAIVGRLVVLAGSEPGVKAIVDVVRDGNSLARARDYRAAMDRVPEQAFIRAYWATPGSDLRELSKGHDPIRGLLGSLVALHEQRFGAAAVALALDDHGLRLEATLLDKRGAKPLRLPACTGEVVEHLPESTTAVAVFGSPESYWKLLKSLPQQALQPLLGGEAGDSLGRIEETVAQLTGSDLNEGWLSWMNQECAVALTRPTITPAPAVAVILGTDQPERMAQALAGLRLRAALIPGVQMGVPNMELSGWLDSVTIIHTAPFLAVKAEPVIATAADAAVLASDPETVSSLLPRRGRRSLRESATYRRARAALPDRPAAFLYVGASGAFQAAEQAGVGNISILPIDAVAGTLKGVECLAIGFAPEPGGQRMVVWLGVDWDQLFTQPALATE